MKHSHVELPSNRKFGLFFAAVFVALGIYFYIQEFGVISIVFAILAIVFALISIVRADLLLPLNKLWMRIGLLLGAIVNPIVLGAIFFILFTPIGFLMRMFGRDELKIKNSKSETYWTPRESNETSAESFKHQF